MNAIGEKEDHSQDPNIGKEIIIKPSRIKTKNSQATAPIVFSSFHVYRFS